MKVEYTKVSESDPNVIALAKVSGESPKAVAAMLNQQSYRRSYQKAQAERMKVLRKLVAEHPELVGGGGK